MFEALYEIFGLNPFYSENLALLLRGAEDLCGQEYASTQLYALFGIVMFLSTAFVYALQYHIIDKSKFSGPAWWWIFAAIALVFNFAFAFIKMYNLLNNGVLLFDCDEEFFKVIYDSDLFLFALDNAMWSLILFAVLSCPPLLRRFSKNCFNTTAFTR